MTSRSKITFSFKIALILYLQNIHVFYSSIVSVKNDTSALLPRIRVSACSV